MTPTLAQTFPGMEWIPVMLLSTGGGLAAGLLAIPLRPFNKTRIAGRRLAIGAIVIGIVFPLFYLCVVGREVNPLGYLIFASPAALGGIAMLIHPRGRVEAHGFPVLTATGDAPAAEQ